MDCTGPVWRPPFEAGSPFKKTEEALKEIPAHHSERQADKGREGL
ncbi:hypothetical protein SY1_23430 [Fretibacterium fastidiosum]|uniref:Uncharacterized protein n=1 Tax=Fretibacterium fastidiosum TaxID=651822 RepID=A0AB94IZ54_9BACT|nr:hypothetical protein SY1_23430 [Fretibacterium fastidiosum]